MNNFLWLEQWYQQYSEQSSGISISTTEPPGWHVRIALQHTPWDSLPNAVLKDTRHNETDWMTCRLIAGTFDAVGGPLMLGPIIQTFRNWIESQA